jgi:hypothetical protein
MPIHVLLLLALVGLNVEGAAGLPAGESRRDLDFDSDLKAGVDEQPGGVTLGE